MTESVTLLLAVGLLAVGTYAFRLAGPLLRGRFTLSVAAERVLAVATVVLLAALVATAAMTEGDGFAGWARPAGVLVGGVLALRLASCSARQAPSKLETWLAQAPLVVVLVAAAGTAALLRALGVP